MSGEPKTLTLTLEEAMFHIADEGRYRLACGRSAQNTLDWLVLDKSGAVLSASRDWEVAATRALGVPVVARDEANDNGLRNAVTAFVDKHFHGGSKANRPDYVTMVPTADVYALREALYAARGTTPLQDHKYMADLRAEAAELREGIAAVVKRLEDAGFTTSDNLDALLSIVWDLRRLAGGENQK